MRTSPKKTLRLVISALLLGGMVCGCDTTPTATVEFSATPPRPTATLPVEATYNALVSASATALVVTPAILPTATLKQPPATLRQPTATLAQPPATVAPIYPRCQHSRPQAPTPAYRQQCGGSVSRRRGALSRVPCRTRLALPATFFQRRPKTRFAPPATVLRCGTCLRARKEQVYAEYGIVSHTTGEYEVDHFVPLELGGSNDISNLFPEAASPKPGFHEKD